MDEEPDLAEYYADNLIGGAGAFLVTADDANDFARAIRQKLILEISEGQLALWDAEPSHRSAAREVQEIGG